MFDCVTVCDYIVINILPIIDHVDFLFILQNVHHWNCLGKTVNVFLRQDGWRNNVGKLHRKTLLDI